MIFPWVALAVVVLVWYKTMKTIKQWVTISLRTHVEVAKAMMGKPNEIDGHSKH
jgi:hypothetical protein